ncbi:MAG: hypothetical protein Hyperionvirus3_48 [Hyperionvirus sp.]|uniref:Uncharacterized protein n=1 Tax=Hyperionvirus sp. TaxID=2487770 RepID=A0A3G5A782_9VIRU|nr:MAG: hypothetical protein Hyperionvirus3_48 [Hyperionvirus sp.]
MSDLLEAIYTETLRASLSHCSFIDGFIEVLIEVFI